MCGRLVQVTSPERVALRFEAVDTIGAEHRPRYNVAPSTLVPAIIDADGRRLGLLSWGYVPPWAESSSGGPRPINARSEGAVSSRLFGPALTRHRCVVPVDGWYEWTEEDGARQPWLLAPEPAGPAAIAALWSTWRPRDERDTATSRLSTVALLTTEATGAAADVHHRMPVVVPDDVLDDWLDPLATDPGGILAALAARATSVRVTRVSRRVNDVRNDDASLLDGVERCVSGDAGR
jgi:putative SOS response-associated peptidase YedK